MNFRVIGLTATHDSGLIATQVSGLIPPPPVEFFGTLFVFLSNGLIEGPFSKPNQGLEGLIEVPTAQASL